MTDRELLELAAKAVVIKGEWVRDYSIVQERYYFNVPYDNQGMLSGFEWNPLRDDGDALRLAVKLGMSVLLYSDNPERQVTACQVNNLNIGIHDNPQATWYGDPYAAARRAIVRAAAEIGKKMP